ncbi:MAG: lipopolysaccharide biosynthesis protein [Leptolyngbyaceae cyanobacterium bins.59]|nr:lipopolysaccharide biosynthesis protein [Leptolyngbyaceae cyanobacterium bins.59]
MQFLLRSFYNLKQDRFIRNIGWLGFSEVFIRVSRLVATVILARFLTTEDYGLSAIVLTTYEFIRVFTRNGIIDKIVQADEAEVENVCRTAYSLNWLIAFFLFVVQVAGSFLIAHIYDNPRLILPICLIALTYLIYPLGSIQMALLRRGNRFNIIALAMLTMVATDNVLTGLFALLGWGMWAIVLPKLLVAPILVGICCRYQTWRTNHSWSLAGWQPILKFAGNILGVEMLTTVRENIDYLLIGRLVGVQALGVYYFAFNAGLGISLSAISAIRSSLYSDLCAVRSDPALFQQRYFKSLKTITPIIITLVFLQSSLAPIYVPIVFGHQWVERGALPVLILICLSALSRPFADAASLTLRALGYPQIELRWNGIFTVILATAIWIGTGGGITGAAIAVCATHLLLQPLYSLWATHVVLGKLKTL